MAVSIFLLSESGRWQHALAHEAKLIQWRRSIQLRATPARKLKPRDEVSTARWSRVLIAGKTASQRFARTLEASYLIAGVAGVCPLATLRSLAPLDLELLECLRRKLGADGRRILTVPQHV